MFWGLSAAQLKLTFTDNALRSALLSSRKALSSGQNSASHNFYLAKAPSSGQISVVDKKIWDFYEIMLFAFL